MNLKKTQKAHLSFWKLYDSVKVPFALEKHKDSFNSDNIRIQYLKPTFFFKPWDSSFCIYERVGQKKIPLIFEAWNYIQSGAYHTNFLLLFLFYAKYWPILMFDKKSTNKNYTSRGLKTNWMLSEFKNRNLWKTNKVCALSSYSIRNLMFYFD
jgi:hypothetical protein